MKPARIPIGVIALFAASSSLSCGEPETTETVPTPEGPIVIHLSDVVAEDGEGSLLVEDIAGRALEIHLDGAARILEIDADGSSAALTDEAGGALGASAEPYETGVWFRPRSITADVALLETEGATTVTLSVRGAPVPEARRERSLVWTDSEIVDDPAVVGLARVAGAAAKDGDGGALFDAWFRRFATTPHSERAGPAQLMDEMADSFGPDPSLWDLDELPFKVTAIHNRLDLGPRAGDCGQLRVSFASTHPIYAPLHLLFLFRQEPGADDIAPTGEVHCLGTARRWARLSPLDGSAFVAGASSLLDETLVQGRFLLAESVELTVSPWEWRQWLPDEDGSLDNPPLFQTVATPFLNQPGALRDAFLAFVEENAEALAARELEIPASFRSPSATAAPSVPNEPLSLDGLDPELLAATPDLAYRIEIVGCTACHTDDAEFVQTNVDRTFSPFYDKELDARAVRLDSLNRGEVAAIPPFGPLQAIVAR